MKIFRFKIVFVSRSFLLWFMWELQQFPNVCFLCVVNGLFIAVKSKLKADTDVFICSFVVKQIFCRKAQVCRELGLWDFRLLISAVWAEYGLQQVLFILPWCSAGVFHRLRSSLVSNYSRVCAPSYRVCGLHSEFYLHLYPVQTLEKDHCVPAKCCKVCFLFKSPNYTYLILTYWSTQMLRPSLSLQLESFSSPRTRFRWIQTHFTPGAEGWALDNVLLAPGCPWMCSGHGLCDNGRCV